MKPTKLMLMIGLCRRAGRIICGTPLVCEALQKKTKPSLVLLSLAASEGTQEKIRRKTAFYGVPLQDIALSTGELARAVGKSGDIAAVAVMDDNLAKAVLHATESTGKDEAEPSASMQ